MADLVTRLILDNKNFDKNLKMSSLQIKKFKDIGNSVVGMLGKFAGAAGLAMGATEGFNKWLNATQTTSDAFNNTMNACKGTVDLFFLSLNTGDFSAFNEGISATIAKLKELEELRDSLGDAKLTESFVSSKTESRFSELEAIIRNPKNSIKVREEAFKELQTLIAEYKKDLGDVQVGNKEVLLKSLNAKFPKNKWTENDIDSYLSIYNNDFSSRLRAKQFRTYKDNINNLEKNKYKYTTTNTGAGVYVEKSLDYSILQKINELKQANPFFEKMRLLNIDNDESRKQMLEDYRYGVELKRKGAELDKRSLELQANIEAAKTQKTTSNKEAVKEEPKEYVRDLTTLAGIDTEIKRLEEERLHAGYKQAKVLQDQINFLKEYKEVFSKGGVDELEAPTFTPVKENPIVNPEKIKATDDWAESLNQVATAMGSISQMTNEGAAAWLTWGANIMTSVATAIPAIEAMIALKKQEAVANGAAEAAKTPFVGWLTVGAAVAAVAAAMFSIPKFATGGIVGGNSYSGDRIIAGVNSGEMILNGAQQRNLFNLINGGSVTSSKQVEFKIKGNELVGVLNNYNKKMSRV